MQKKDYLTAGKASRILGIAMTIPLQNTEIEVFLKKVNTIMLEIIYHHRYMYDPQKTRKAMLDAGYDLVAAEQTKKKVG